jgi:hypothetical protein
VPWTIHALKWCSSKASATAYATGGAAEAACLANAGCSGVYDQGCDNAGSWYQCSAAAYATSSSSCVYSKPVAPTPAPTFAPTPPTPAPGTLGCAATVDPTAVAPLPAGTCVSIGPCLAAMPPSCATRTLRLQPGRYAGPQNTRIALAGTDSVAIVGPIAPAPLRAGPGGAPEADTAATPAPPGVATIDGEDAAWLFAVGANATLRLTNVGLARGQGGQFTRVFDLDGKKGSFTLTVFGGGALRVLGSGTVTATGVLFDSNTCGSVSALCVGGAMVTSSDSAVLLDGCLLRNNTAAGKGSGGGVAIYSSSAGSAASVAPVFEQCLFEDNGAFQGGGTLIANAAPHFRNCAWRRNTATDIGGASIVVSSCFCGSGCVCVARPASVAPVFEQCLFEGNSAGSGGGTFVVGAAPRFSGCTWRNNTASGNSAAGKGSGGGVTISSKSVGSAASVAPVFEQCLFERNSAAQGGGTAVQDSAPRFIGCTWHDNTAISLGGGAFVASSSGAVSAVSVAPVFEQCLFERNSARQGGGTVVQDSVPRFIGCTWRDNTKNLIGGGVSVGSSSAASAVSVAPVFDQCLFEGNSAVSGGGMLIINAAPRFIGCTWRGNTALGSCSVASVGRYINECVLGHSGGVERSAGGGLSVALTFAGVSMTVAFEQCAFIRNTVAGKDGGGALNSRAIIAEAPANLAFEADRCNHYSYSCVLPRISAQPPPYINNTFRQWTPRLQLLFGNGTTFDGNEAAAGSGGAISMFGSSVVIRGGASFRNNCAGLSGGAVNLASGTATITLLGPSAWANNSADSARGDHIFSESGAAIALGDAVLQLGGDPTRVREGVVAVHAGNVSWGANSTAICQAGYTLSASTDITTTTFQEWVLEGSSNGTAGFRNGSNCPTYFDNCNGVGLSKSTDPQWAQRGYHDPKATPILPPMRVTRVSVGCAACGATEWSGVTQPLPGFTVATGTATHPLNRTCAVCAGRMSPGIDCESGLLIQHAGWWRADAPTVSFGTQLFPCFTDTCVGSANDTAGLPSFKAQCKAGYTGPVCALCAGGFTMQSGQCNVCPHMNAQNIAGVVLLLLTVFAFCAFVYRKRDSPLLQPAILKITLGFYQLISIMQRSFSVQWPVSYRSAMHGIKIALASVADLPSTACAFTVNWYGRLCIWTFGILAIVLALWGWSRWQHTRGGGALMSDSAAQQKYSLLQRLFYLAFFCYPLAAPVIVSIFDCRTVDGVSYMEADYTLTCEGGDYALAAVWAALWTVCFVLGFPAAVTLALVRQHEAVDFLAADYKAGTVQRLWEVVDLVKKLLLSSAILFVPEGSISRIAFALFIAVSAQVLQAHFAPYNSPHKNRIADAAGMALSLTYFITLLIKVQPLVQESALGVLLILLLVFMAVACIAALVAMKRQAAVVLRTKKKMQGRLAAGAAGEDDDDDGGGAGSIEMGELPSSDIANPAYVDEDDEDEDEDSVAALKAELASVKREHAKYTSARIAAELEKAQAAHEAELRAEREDHERSSAAQVERSAAEAAVLRAELAQLKKEE